MINSEKPNENAQKERSNNALIFQIQMRLCLFQNFIDKENKSLPTWSKHFRTYIPMKSFLLFYRTG